MTEADRHFYETVNPMVANVMLHIKENPVTIIYTQATSLSIVDKHARDAQNQISHDSK
jgi:hypothetical protein